MTDPGVAATGHPARIAEQVAAAASRSSSSTGPGSSRPTSRWSRRSTSPATPGPSTPSWPSAAAQHRHREGGQPAAHQPRRADGLHQRPGRQGERARPARCCRWSPCRPPPAPAARAPRSACSTCSRCTSRPGSATSRCARRWRSSTRPDHQPAGDGHRRVRDGHPVPRAGELHRAVVRRLRRQAPRAAGALLRGQPDRRHVVGEGDDAAGRGVPGRGRATASDAVAREQMAMAATFAGLGFGNAGVHIPHANAYPIAGRVRDYRPEGYPDGRGDRAARHGGLADRARGVPVHLRGRPRAPPARRPAARPRRPPGDAVPTCCPACWPR